VKCTSPHTVGFNVDGTTLNWSGKGRSKEYPTFQLPCNKCIECRLEYGRQWAVRCVHEAQMHEQNAFITLTYSDENLKSSKLIYSDFQKFMKRLRKLKEEPIGLFVTGEYGEKNKRPHWHAIIFNWEPSDLVHARTNERGDRIFSSSTLDRIWGKGFTETGSVTFESAGYCARYAAKKLVHGHDGTHDFNPISKKSSKHAIGKKWLERFWPDVFSYGKCILRRPDGTVTETGIPRYYEKWLKEKHPEAWVDYVTQVKFKICTEASVKSEAVQQEWIDRLWKRASIGKPRPDSPNEVRKIIIQEKFDKLQQHLKL